MRDRVSVESEQPAFTDDAGEETATSSDEAVNESAEAEGTGDESAEAAAESSAESADVEEEKKEE